MDKSISEGSGSSESRDNEKQDLAAQLEELDQRGNKRQKISSSYGEVSQLNNERALTPNAT